jgi:hypothetical protein
VPIGIIPGPGWFMYAVPAIFASMALMVILGYWWSRGGDE